MIHTVIRRTLLLAAIALTTHLPLQAQDAAPKSPTYDAVSIKPNKIGSDSSNTDSSPEGYNATNTSFKRLVQYAYHLFSDDQITGIPSQLDGARFDVLCKADAEMVAALRKMPREQRAATEQAMMQAMLEERFHLKVHPSTKEASIYTLVVAKSGLKLTEADPEHAENNARPGSPEAYSKGSMGTSVDDHAGTMTGQSVKLTRLAEALSFRVNRLVFDKTGLNGDYDFILKWTEDRDGQAAADDTKAPNIFTALQEQLGLRLESTRGPIPLVVVDHAEFPTEN